MRNVSFLRFAPHTTASSSTHISLLAKVQKKVHRLIKMNKSRCEVRGKDRNHPLSPSAGAHFSPLIYESTPNLK